MTKEKFLYGLNACAVTYHNGQKFYEHDELIKCFEDLEMFEQEPCDTVSRGVFEQVMWERDVAIKQLKELGYGLGEKPKTGQWIKISPADIFECSECGQNVMTDDICVYRYCHGCGAKMAESEGEHG